MMADIALMKMAETLLPTKFDLPWASITFDLIVKLVIEFAKIRGTVTQFDYILVRIYDAR
jgi:hypothetical protein